MPSPYRSSILNGIAYGLVTRMEISEKMGISYGSVSNNIRKLVSEGKVSNHDGEGEKYYSLTKHERWRLGSFDHTKLFVENEEPYFLFSSQSVYDFENFSVKEARIEGEGRVTIVQCDMGIENLLNEIDRKYSLKNYLPSLIISSQKNISLKTLDNIKVFVTYRLPIYFVNEDYELFPFQLPNHCEMVEFENETLEEVYEIVKDHPNTKTSDIADHMNLRKETVRKKLKILEKQEKIEMERNGHFAEAVWKIVEKND